MKSSIVALGALLLIGVTAQPHGHQHQHNHLHNHHHKRDVIVYETEWVIVTETVEMTATVYIDADSTTTLGPAEFFQTQGPVATATTETFTSFSIHTLPPASLSALHVAPTAPVPTTSTSTLVAPAPAPPAPEPTISSVYTAPPPPPPASSTTTSEYVAPPAPPAQTAPESTTSTTSTEAPYVPTPSTVAAAAPTTVPSSGYTGICASGSPCKGDITYYEAGLGACGWNTDGESDMVIALPVGLMGSQSNGNPFCGKSVTIALGGKTVLATVADKCMGCVGNSIDLSNKAFAALADFSVGRTQAEWWFN